MHYILIYCEGETEQIYFNILKRVFRTPYVQIEAVDCHKQHQALIKSAVERKNEFCKENDIDESVVEVWAVCDRDDYAGQFAKLKEYADKLAVKLAFSDPQFENFLLQHFSRSNNADHGKKVERAMAEAMHNDGIESDYCKTDLQWLEDKLLVKMSIIKMAIANADIRNKPSVKPFFTIQNLVREIVNAAGMQW